MFIKTFPLRDERWLIAQYVGRVAGYACHLALTGRALLGTWLAGYACHLALTGRTLLGTVARYVAGWVCVSLGADWAYVARYGC